MFMYNHSVQMTLIKDLYQYGKKCLASNSVPSPDLDAAILLNKVTGYELTDIYRDPEIDIPQDLVKQYSELLERRKSHEPVAYILGHKEFYSRMFIVNGDVLIPRPETELLVDEVIKRAKSMISPVILDIGTGSGCIAVTLKAELDDSVCIASDISACALDVAGKNAYLNNVNLEFVCGDFLNAFKNKSIDIIVSNPPYVSEKDYTDLEKNVRDFEPRNALVSETDGMFAIRQIVFYSKYVIKNGGWLLIEIGCDQSERVIELFKSNGFINIQSVKDITGIDRVIKAQWTN